MQAGREKDPPCLQSIQPRVSTRERPTPWAILA
jgi:hypothetical protein